MRKFSRLVKAHYDDLIRFWVYATQYGARECVGGGESDIDIMFSLKDYNVYIMGSDSDTYSITWKNWTTGVERSQRNIDSTFIFNQLDHLGVS